MMEFEDVGIKTIPNKLRWATTCPQCSKDRKKSKAPCLTVNNEAGNRWFRCWNCNFSGNLDVLDKFDKVRDSSKMPEQEREFTAGTRKYITGRGLSPALFKKMKIYETTNKGITLLCFPYFMNVTLVNVKFLNLTWDSGKKMAKWFQLPKDLGTRIIPFGMQDLNFEDIPAGKRVILISEGEIDCLTWKECEYRNSISVPQGAPSEKAKDFKAEFAWTQDPYVKSVFADVDIFLLSVDADGPGELLRKHLAMILGKEKCRIVRYPPGYKDINEVFNGSKKKGLEALGKEGVDDCYKNLGTIPVKGIIRPSDVREELEILRNDGFVPGYGIGIPEVDRLYTVKPKHISFITGIPGSSKSVYTRWWTSKLIQNNPDMDMRWAFFSPENRPVSREQAMFAQVIVGAFAKKGRKDSMSDEAWRKALQFVEKHIIIISPHRLNYENWGDAKPLKKVNTLDNLQKYLIYLKKTENIFGYVIDAWNKIEHEQPKYQTDTNFISEQLDTMIDFGDYYDLHGTIVVHPRKIEMSGVNYKMPSLYDIKGSSAWKEKADIGIIAHRYKMKQYTKEEAVRKFNKELNELDEDEKWYAVPNAPTIIRTEKIRFEELGVEDRVRLLMDKYGRFFVDKSKSTYKDPDNTPKMAELPIFDEDDSKDEGLPF